MARAADPRRYLPARCRGNVFIEADQYRDRTAEAGTQNPKLPDALQGIAGDESDTENVKDVMKHFYGQRTTASTAESQERSLTEYYRDRIQDR
jgi:hypothetical protein